MFELVYGLGLGLGLVKEFKFCETTACLRHCYQFFLSKAQNFKILVIAPEFLRESISNNLLQSS